MRSQRKGTGSGRPRPDRRAALPIAALVQRLESRELLTLAVTPISAVQATLFRGQVATFAGGEVTVNTALDYRAEVNWGDGSAVETVIPQPRAGGGFEVNAEHIYTRVGLFNLGVTLKGLQSTSVASSGVATVMDARPVLAATGIAAAIGSSFSGTVATFTDPGPDLPGEYLATIDWGDGSPITAGTVTGGASGTFSIAGTHTYAAPGARPYSVTLTTRAGTVVSATGTARVTDPAPVVSASAGINFVAGLRQTAPVATFRDLDPALNASDFQATIDWGDKTPLSAATIAAATNGGFVISGTHNFAAAGIFNGEVRLTRLGDATTVTGAIRPVVEAPALTGSAANIAPSTGLTFRGVVATFADNNPDAIAGDFQATIDWGDGTPITAGSIAPLPGGGFGIAGTHTYAAPNASLTVVTRIVRLATGASLSLRGSATVTDPRLSVATQAVSAVAGQPFLGPVATITDSNTSAVAADYAVSVDWGDGSSSGTGDLKVIANPVVAGQPPTFRVEGQHTFALPGAPEVAIRVVRRNGGATALGRTTAAVAAPATAITPFSTNLTATAGVLLKDAVVGVFTADPMAASTDFSANIAWGDGVTSVGDVQPRAGGGFQVVGSHTYSATSGGAGFAVTTTVTRKFSGSQSATINSIATVVAPAFTAGLAASSDSGASDHDGITRVAQPEFLGTATPFSVVRIEARRDDGAALTIGSAAVAADGSWSLRAGEPLRDGSYLIQAVLIPPKGAPVTTSALPALVIDTVAPRVTGFAYARKPGTLVATFRDSLSGMDEAGLARGANYNLLGNGIARPGTAVPTEPLQTAVVPGDPRAVKVTINTRLVKSGLKRLRILAAGITDRAGNPLDGEFNRKLPSGNGRAGGDFIAPLSAAARKLPISATLQAARRK